MKHFKNPATAEIFAFEADGSQDHLIGEHLVELTAAEVFALHNPPLTQADFQRAHDEHLNGGARERNYDSIHTAALRAGYAGPYQAEGVAYAQWMDLCNQTGYQILSDVQSGAIPPPATIASYIALLPPLVLP